MAWRWAAASEIGTSHISSGDHLEDAYAVTMMTHDHLFAIVSDGAGSAKYGRHGAWLTCRFLKVHFREWFKRNTELPTDEKIVEWIESLRDQISTVALSRNSTSRQFACTLALLVVSEDGFMTIQVGDSAIVGRRDMEWQVVCWPENGEYASTTYFVTDDPEPRLRISRYSKNMDAFAIFSDGVGDLALSHTQQTAAPQFFDPIMRPVDNADKEGRLPELSTKLKTFLSSAAVCEKTDDDKTLLIISGT